MNRFGNVFVHFHFAKSSFRSEHKKEMALWKLAGRLGRTVLPLEPTSGPVENAASFSNQAHTSVASSTSTSSQTFWLRCQFQKCKSRKKTQEDSGSTLLDLTALPPSPSSSAGLAPLIKILSNTPRFILIRFCIAFPAVKISQPWILICAVDAGVYNCLHDSSLQPHLQGDGRGDCRNRGSWQFQSVGLSEN